jgi:CPA1 family monovalent cation:H+ antiporter
MGNFEVIIFLLVILVGLAAVADKQRLPYPIVLVIAGLIIGFIPVLPDLVLDPDVVFLLFLPPLLYHAAAKTSWQDFKASIRPISALAITLVFFTTMAVAIAAHYFIPHFSWPLAFVLGAIVSPPDAVAATSITQGLGLNKKVITILEGESLVNDATALIAYRYAVAAVSTGSFILWKAGLHFLFVAAGGILVGIATGYLFVFLHRKIRDNSLVETSLSLLTPFIAYQLAEHLHTSGVLSVVSAGLLIARRSPEMLSYETRMQNRAVWDTLIFLLNGIVFILIGLQLPTILKGLAQYTLGRLMGYGFLISMVTVVMRVVWVFAGASYSKAPHRKSQEPDEPLAEGPEIAWKNVMIIAWTGTRGVVSLAAALALPLSLQDGSVFPQRNLVLFLAFIVIFVTLMVQGLSLPLLIRLLGIKPQQDNTRERKELQLLIARSTIDFIGHELPTPLEDKIKDQITKSYEQLALQLEKDINNIKSDANQGSLLPLAPLNHLLAAQVEIARFQRSLLIKLHKEGRFSDEAIRRIEREFDIEDMRLNAMVQKSKE